MLLGCALQIELGHRPLLEEPCPLCSAVRNLLPCALYLNISHTLPIKCLTYLRHCRSSNAIYVPVDRNIATSSSKSPCWDLSWANPYHIGLPCPCQELLPLVVASAEAPTLSFAASSCRQVWPWLPSSRPKSLHHSQRAHILDHPQLIPVPRKVPNARGWGCPGAPAALQLAVGGMHPGCQAVPWQTPTDTLFCPWVTPEPNRALTVLSHSLLLLHFWMMPSPLLAISDPFSLASIMTLSGKIK